jgi:hypothetical protein
MVLRRARIAFVCGLVPALAGPAVAGPPSPTYAGAAACASQNCHGSVQPRRDSETSLQNEYVTWYQQDRHAKAYAVLVDERAQQIATRLGMSEAPREAKRCLDCHALNVPPKARGARFRLEDGVSCEACHGPAGAWLERHTERDWKPERSLALGMRDTMRPHVAAETCLGCHLGSATKRVDHELLAAGHPPLAFELDTFAANMPAHWAEHAENRSWFRGEAWAAGQVVAAREAALQFVRQVHEHGWPDFAAYDCQACHHEISGKTPWRLRGTRGRPPLDGAHRPGVDALARVVAPERREAVGASETGLAAAALGGSAGPDVDRAAAAVRDQTNHLLGAVEKTRLDEARIMALMRTLVDLAEPTAQLGFRAAQQAAWALDALADARAVQAKASGKPVDDTALRASIGHVYDGLADPATYDAARTARSLAAVRASLR